MMMYLGMPRKRLKPRLAILVVGCFLWGQAVGMSENQLTSEELLAKKELKLRLKLVHEPQLKDANLGIRLNGRQAELWGIANNHEQIDIAKNLLKEELKDYKVITDVTIREYVTSSEVVSQMVKEYRANPGLARRLEEERELAAKEMIKNNIPTELVVNRQQYDERSPLDKYLAVLADDPRFAGLRFNLQDGVMRIEGEIREPGLAYKLAAQFNKFPQIRQTLVLVQRP